MLHTQICVNLKHATQDDEGLSHKNQGTESCSHYNPQEVNPDPEIDEWLQGLKEEEWGSSKQFM